MTAHFAGILAGLFAKLFRGGAPILYIAFLAFIGVLYVEYRSVKTAVIAVTTERDDWKAQALGHQSALLTLRQQSLRKTVLEKDTRHAETIIASVPDGRQCVESEPLRAASDWLRDYRAGPSRNDGNTADVSLPSQTRPPKIAAE